MSLSPESQSKVRASNFSLEVSSWFAEQILTSPQPQTFFLLVFPEDFGGDSCTGPASPWSAREFTNLSDAVEAQRGAVYLCRFAGAEYRRSVGVADERTSLERGHVPRLASFSTRRTARYNTVDLYRRLVHVPLCIRLCEDSRRKEVSDPSLPNRSVHSFGLASSTGCKSHSCTVPSGMGYRAVQLVLSLMVVSLVTASPWADSPDSVEALYWEWKANTLTRSPTPRFLRIQDSTLSSSQGDWLVTLCYYSRCSRPACKFLDSRRAARAGSGFLVVSSCSSLAPLSVRSPSLRGDDHVPGVSTHLGNSSHHSSSSGVTGLQPVFDGEKSFEHSPPPGDGKVWIHTSQPDESERLSDQAHLQGIPRGTASVDVEHAPSPGFSSSTSKRKFPRELDERAGRRCTIRRAGFGTWYWALEYPPHRHVRVCNHLRSVVGWEDRMAMAVPRCLQLALLRATSAHKTGNCAGCVLTYKFLVVSFPSSISACCCRDGVPPLPWTPGHYQAAHGAGTFT